jgi:hypothetical protein
VSQKTERDPTRSSASNQFDPASLRLDQKFAETVGVKKLLVPVRKANRQDFVGVHPDERFGSDRAVKDLPRMMRVPGFRHLKDKPFRSRIIRISNAPPFPASDFAASMTPVDLHRVRGALSARIPSMTIFGESFGAGTKMAASSTLPLTSMSTT